jgi:hypothetical protein
MADMRLSEARGKHATLHCSCGWSLWRESGFTKNEAMALSRKHKTDECPDVDNLIKLYRMGEF